MINRSIADMIAEKADITPNKHPRTTDHLIVIRQLANSMALIKSRILELVYRSIAIN